jgi:hypothetical protein
MRVLNHITQLHQIENQNKAEVPATGSASKGILDSINNNMGFISGLSWSLNLS